MGCDNRSMSDIRFYITCVSLTWFLVSHRESIKFQAEIFHKAYIGIPDDKQTHLINYTVKNRFYHFLYELITCAWCMGTWVAIIGTIVMYLIFGVQFTLWDIISNWFIVAIFSVIICTYTEKNERRDN